MPIVKKIRSNFSYYRNEIINHGIKFFISNRFRRLEDFSSYHLAKVTLATKSFSFNGKNYHYFVHPYNFTWRNERAIEVPVGRKLLENYKTQEILEVGNVLNHYFPVSHDILDKYEIAPGVINEDVVSYKPAKKYDLILSLSTLEHVGWDEIPQEKNKILKAVAHLKTLLKKNGTLFSTLPLGYYNKILQDIIEKNKLHFSEQYFMKRISSNNLWRQTNWNEVKNVRYNSPFSHANGIIIGVIRK